MADTSFLLGMLQGGATGVVNNQIAMREQELQKERAQLQIAGELIRSGQFETFLALDPKIRKAAGVSPELEGALGSLIGVQRQERTARMQGLLAQTRSAEATAAGQEMTLQQERQKQAIIQARPAGEREELLVPEIAQRRTLAAQQRTAEVKTQEAELDIQTKQRANAAYEQLSPINKFMVDFPDVAKIESAERIAGKQISATAANAAADRALKEKLAVFDASEREKIANLGLTKATQVEATKLQNQQKGILTEIARVHSKIKNKTKAGNFSYGTFTTEEEATAYANQVNMFVKEYNDIEQQQAAIKGTEPDLMQPWAVLDKSNRGWLADWFAKDQFIVGPPVGAGVQAPGAQAAPAVSEFEQRLQKLLGELQGGGAAATTAPAGPSGAAAAPSPSQAAPQAEPSAKINSKQMNSATVHFQNLYTDAAQQDEAINRYIELRNQGLTHAAAMNTAARASAKR